DAIRLIAECDKHIHQQLVAMTRILVLPYPSNAYWYTSRTCVLSISVMLERSEALTASSIVHELTHAIIHKKGFIVWPDILHRIEAMCIRAQAQFVDKLPRDRYPGTDRLLAYYDQQRATLLNHVTVAAGSRVPSQ